MSNEHELNKGCLVLTVGGIIFSLFAAYKFQNYDIDVNKKYIGEGIPLFIDYVIRFGIILLGCTVVSAFSHTMYQNYKNPKSNTRP